MDQGVYESIGRLLEKHGIEEEPEDLLLELAEQIGDQLACGTDVTVKAVYGKLTAQATGYKEEQDEEDPCVYIKTMTLGGQIFTIEEYLL